MSNSDSKQQGRKPSFTHFSETYLLTEAQLLKHGMAHAWGLKSKTNERFQASTAAQLRPSLLRKAGQRSGLDERRPKTQIAENAVIISYLNSIRDHGPRFRGVGKRRRRNPLWMSVAKQCYRLQAGIGVKISWYKKQLSCSKYSFATGLVFIHRHKWMMICTRSGSVNTNILYYKNVICL